MRAAALAVSLLLLQPTHQAIAADIAAGEAKAKTCATCHGRNGVGTAPNFPNIAGQKSIYLTEQLQLFRSGERKNEQMSIIAKKLTDEDIANLAAYYESLPPAK